MLRGLSVNKEKELLFFILTSHRSAGNEECCKATNKEIYAAQGDCTSAHLYSLCSANLDHEAEDFSFLPKYRPSSPVLYIGQIVALKDVQDLSYEVLSLVSYWPILTLCNSKKFEFQRRVNKTICKSPVRSCLYKQAENQAILAELSRIETLL